MLSLFAAQVRARPVVVLRIVIGAVCVVRGLIELQFIKRVFQPTVIRFPVLDWLPVVNRRFALVLLLVWLVCAILFAAGYFVRPAGLILAAAMGASLFLDQQLYSSHLYLLTLDVFLIAIANPVASAQTIKYWPVLLLKLQLSIVYFFAGLSKINALYLSGVMIGVNLRRGLSFGPSTLRVLAVVSIIVESFLALAFWHRRTRKLAVVIGAVFHIGLVAMLIPTVAAQLALFAVACIAVYPLYFIEPSRESN